MKKLVPVGALAALLASCATPPAPPPPQPPPLPLAGDTVVVLASDTTFGPSTADAETAARYYCSARGELLQLVSRDRPQEMSQPILSEFAVLTYRCYRPSGR
jgi:hypothetical protein